MLVTHLYLDVLETLRYSFVFSRRRRRVEPPTARTGDRTCGLATATVCGTADGVTVGCVRAGQYLHRDCYSVRYSRWHYCWLSEGRSVSTQGLLQCVVQQMALLWAV